MANPSPVPALADRLGYLLKHAQLQLSELTTAAMAPFGVTGRQCAVLIAIQDQVPQSQQEAARRLGVDRTTMVALIDELEHMDLVIRRQDPYDRRKNVVALTDLGKATLRDATSAGVEAEKRFLAAVSDTDAATFRQILRTVVLGPAEPTPSV